MRVLRHVAEATCRHAIEAYPEECCGALYSRSGVVVRSARLPNRAGARRQRFLVGPRDYVAAEQQAAERGESLAGFYHSHPDGAATASEFDREHALPNLSYVIVAVGPEGTREVTSWRLREDRSVFDPEPIERVESGPGD